MKLVTVLKSTERHKMDNSFILSQRHRRHSCVLHYDDILWTGKRHQKTERTGLGGLGVRKKRLGMTLPDEDPDDEQDAHSACRFFHASAPRVSLPVMLRKVCQLAEGFTTLLTRIRLLPSRNPLLLR